MTKRKHVTNAETEVLRRSGRRCCVCFALHRDLGVKRGQIAHLDRNPANSTVANLAFLCLEHHDQYDSRTSQSKGLTVQEIESYRSELCKTMKAFRAMKDKGLHICSMAKLHQYMNEQRAWCLQITNKMDCLADEWRGFRGTVQAQIRDALSKERD